MSAQQPHRDLSGVLFTNDPAKKKTENSPDAGGEATVNGIRFRIAGWWKTSKRQDGPRWLALAFTPAPSPNGTHKETP